jgi:hypothetical protein
MHLPLKYKILLPTLLFRDLSLLLHGVDVGVAAHPLGIHWLLVELRRERCWRRIHRQERVLI